MPKRRKGVRGKPWYWRKRDAWYIKVNGQRIPLQSNGQPIRGRGNEQEALNVWHQMMTVANAPSNGDDNTLSVVFEMFLRDVERRAKPKTFRDYQKFFSDFNRTVSGMLVKDLRPAHLYAWWDNHPEWGDSMRLLTAKAIHAALNWAAGAQGGLINKNPLKGMKMPQWKSRGAETLISDADHQTIMTNVPSDLADVLMTLRLTGTRPGMVAKVEAKDFDAEAGIWSIRDNKTYYRTGRPLVVFLPPQVVELCQKLAKQYPEGPMFRTARGEPWNPQKLASRVYWYKKQLGLDNLIAYGYRHTVTTELLEKGVPDAQVAAIVGHQNTDMIYKHYSHLGSKIKQLRDVLVKNITTAGNGSQS